MAMPAQLSRSHTTHQTTSSLHTAGNQLALPYPLSGNITTIITVTIITVTFQSIDQTSVLWTAHSCLQLCHKQLFLIRYICIAGVV